jgi:hypothetical protein
MLINLLLTNTSSQNLVVGILHDLPNPPINTHKMCLHLDLPEWVVDTIELWRLAMMTVTTIHVAFVDHGPIKVE